MQYCIFLVMVLTCGYSSIDQNIFGEYVAQGTDFSYKLILNSDSTFSLSEKQKHIEQRCSGKWSSKGTYLIELTCDDAKTVEEEVSTSYMTQRVRQVELLRKGKLKIDNVILKKRK